MNEHKLAFLQHEMMPLLHKLTATGTGKWGKMNAQQMVEHVTAFFKVSTEKIKFPLLTPIEHLPKYKEFLFSEKEFRENTKAPEEIIGEEALPVHYKTMEEAVEKLGTEKENFIETFRADPSRKSLHPVFGELNFEEWVLLHHKHVTHHWKQFGLL